MTNHTWKTGEPVDCAQAGFHAFTHCAVCGVMRVNGDPYTSLRFETETVVPQDTIINVERRAARVRRESHFVDFSNDCQIAQEQVLFYVLGRLQALMVIGDRYGGGSVIARAIQDRHTSMPYAAIMRAYWMLEAQVQGPDDLRAVLEGLEPVSPTTGPLLEVDL